MACEETSGTGWDVQLCFAGATSTGGSSVARGSEADRRGAGSLSGELDALYAEGGRPSIAPEYILRALLLQVFFSVRSERLLVEQIDYNLLFRWFVGLGMDDGCGTMRCSRRTATGC